ncbi:MULTISPECIES: glycosyltransferase family 2 protein [unclassified Thermococcus]|uniref:glycosyltransferase family 2 protein n=1 Tax=unclassified Thermococcus TaxID=2627626 RepID=UPI001F0E1DA1|nr:MULTISPECIES: glycosyltransferase [unclassified Thermococcus]
MLEVSVVISTLYKRPEELAECLRSIAGQSVKPIEVILINGAPSREEKRKVESEIKLLRSRGIAVKRFHLPSCSLPHARNVGAKMARGDVILFLDDDVILERDYLKNVILTYEEHPDAMGVQGFITNRINPNNPLIRFGFLKFLWWLLQRGYYEVDVHKQLPSLFEVLPYRVTRVIRRESFSGTNMSFRREVFRHLEFDERLKEYAVGEDKDFSYRLHRLFPGSLYQTPHARLVHQEAPAGRLASRGFEVMRQVYHLYLFYKLFENTLPNRIRYALGRMGDLLLYSILFATSGFKRENARRIIYMIEGLVMATLNRNRIKKRGKLLDGAGSSWGE